MPMILPDVQPFVRDLQQLEHVFNLSTARWNLGELLLDMTVEAIQVVTTQEEAPNGTPWAALSPSYEQWKIATVGHKPIGVLFGIMLQEHEIKGVRTISTNWATMTYGISNEALIHAWKFQEGGIVTGQNQPPRPFYTHNYLSIMEAGTILDGHFRTFTL